MAYLFDFSPVCFQMSHQITCQSGCKVTLVALIFVYYTFPNVSSNNLHKKLLLLHISLYMSVKLLMFSLTIFRFCLTLLGKCLINVKQMVYCIFAEKLVTKIIKWWGDFTWIRWGDLISWNTFSSLSTDQWMSEPILVLPK